LPVDRSQQSINGMMARLLREHWPDHLVAAQVRRVVSLVSGELAHQTRREDMLRRATPCCRSGDAADSDPLPADRESWAHRTSAGCKKDSRETDSYRLACSRI